MLKEQYGGFKFEWRISPNKIREKFDAILMKKFYVWKKVIKEQILRISEGRLLHPAQPINIMPENKNPHRLNEENGKARKIFLHDMATAISYLLLLFLINTIVWLAELLIEWMHISFFKHKFKLRIFKWTFRVNTRKIKMIKRFSIINIMWCLFFLTALIVTQQQVTKEQIQDEVIFSKCLKFKSTVFNKMWVSYILKLSFFVYKAYQFIGIGLHGNSGSNLLPCLLIGKEITLLWAHDKPEVEQVFKSYHKSGYKHSNRSIFFGNLQMATMHDFWYTFSIHMPGPRIIAACIWNEAG